MLPVLTVNRVLICDSLVFSDRVREESKLLIILGSRDEKKEKENRIQSYKFVTVQILIMIILINLEFPL